jgi:hypothetical protein
MLRGVASERSPTALRIDTSDLATPQQSGALVLFLSRITACSRR